MITKIFSERWLDLVAGALIFTSLNTLIQWIQALNILLNQLTDRSLTWEWFLGTGLAIAGFIIGVRLFRNGRKCILEATVYVITIILVPLVWAGVEGFTLYRKFLGSSYSRSPFWQLFLYTVLPIAINSCLLKILLKARVSTDMAAPPTN